MLPAQHPLLHRFRLTSPHRAAVITGLAALAGFPTLALAQQTAEQTIAAVPADDSGPIGYEADRIEYSEDQDVITAIGDVVMRRGDQSVRADKISWNRKTGKILASGNVRFVDKDGNQLFTGQVELSDELKAGAMANMLLALREGGRLAAISGTRDAEGNVVLSHAAYSACAVEDDSGCPRRPSWRITSEKVTYDPAQKRVRFDGARLELFGVRLLPMPGLMLTTDGRAVSGLLIPDLRLSASNGVEISQTYYQRLANTRDLALTGYVYTKALPMISVQYRQLTGNGAFQLTGYATRSARIDSTGIRHTDFRGYLFANGRFQFSPGWSVSASTRIASDRTFLRRYDISQDDRLRTVAELEHVDRDSYLSVAGWATQTLRTNAAQGQVPVALPVIDYRRRIAAPVLGGRIDLQVNSLAITRSGGQDTQRAFAGAQWNLRRITGMGQDVSLTALVRGDVYHSDQNALSATAVYRGNPGWQARAVATAAVDVKWPLIGKFLKGTQVLTPRLQLVASPATRNLAIPNEDSRAVDLEDSNLFALNRFAGYDRIEDGLRLTYGFDWQFGQPGWSIKSTIGQSYRLTSYPTLIPDGTGLSSQLSDIVGRTEVRFRDIVKLTHRFRLDKDSLAVRRNEFDAAVGTNRTYLEIGYSRLNRNIPVTLEDLHDSNELRLAGRVAFARYWSLFGSGVFSLGSSNQSTTLTTTGFQALRTRLGAAYQDDCLDIAFTWQRNYVATGDAQKGNIYQINVAFRNLGFR